MRKFPLALVISFLLMALAACSINSQSVDEKNVIIFTVDLSGYEQRGYAVGTRNLHVWVRNFFSTNYEMIDTSMSAQVDSATGKYSLTGAVLKDTIVEIQSGADDYIDITGHRLIRYGPGVLGKRQGAKDNKRELPDNASVGIGEA